MATLRFNGTRADVVAAAVQLARMLSGRAVDTFGIMRGFGSAIGFAVLSDIQAAYIEKSRGGTDEAGIRWPKLQPRTIANRRVGAGDRRDSDLIRRRETIRKRETKKALRRFLLSLPESEARRRAAIVGGIKATQQTGRTKLKTLGNRNVEILRDRGILFNSLSPGSLVGDPATAAYTPPSGDGAEEQIFEVRQGLISAGTNVVYASTHQHGDASRNIPARPIFPPEDQIPNVWWQRWLGVGSQALVAAMRLLLANR
jgi:hypothetical protein